MYAADGNIWPHGWVSQAHLEALGLFSFLFLQVFNRSLGLRAWDTNGVQCVLYAVWNRCTAEGGPVNSRTNFDDTARNENFDNPGELRRGRLSARRTMPSVIDARHVCESPTLAVAPI